MRAATSGGSGGPSSTGELLSTSTGGAYAAVRDRELSAVVSRYVAAWAQDATPSAEEDIDKDAAASSADALPTNNITPATNCTLIPLARFLHAHNMAPFPRVHSPLSDSEQPSAKRAAFAPPPALRCEHCDVTATSQEHLSTHMRGAKHARRMQLVAADADIAREFGPGGLLEKLDFAKWRCLPCNADMCASAVATHMGGARHRSKLRMRDRLSAVAHTEHYVCARCNVACSSEAAFTAHLASPAHRHVHGFAPPPPRGIPVPAAVVDRVGDKVDSVLSTPRSPRHMQFTQTAAPGTPRPHTTSTSPGAPSSPRAPLNAAAKEFRPAGAASSWRPVSAAPSAAASSPPAAQASAGSDIADWRASLRPVPAGVRPARKKGVTREFPCTTCPVVCNSQQTLNDHLNSAKHERAVRAVRENAARSAAASMENSKAEQPPVTRDGTPVEESSPPHVPTSPVHAAAGNSPMEVDSPATPAKQTHALVLVGGPSLERTPTSSVQEQPGAGNRLPALSLHRLGSFEIAPSSKSNSPSVAKADDVTTQSRTSSLAFVPASMAFANKDPQMEAVALGSGAGAAEKKGEKAMEKMEKDGTAMDEPRSEVFSAVATAAAQAQLRNLEELGVVPQKPVAEVVGTPGKRACTPQPSAVAAGREENATMSELPQPVAAPEAMNVTRAEDETQGGSGKGGEMSRMQAASGVGAAMWAATKTTPTAPSENPVADAEELEEGEVDERGTPGLAKTLQFGKVAVIPMEDVTGTRTLEDGGRKLEGVGEQEAEKAVVVNTAMQQATGTGGANAEAGTLDVPNLAVQSFTAQSVVSRTKRKKSKGGQGTRSPTPEKDLSQWYCGICRVQCNADAPFQDHLNSAKHIKLLQGPAGSADGTGFGRALSPSLSPGKRKNSPPRKKKKKADEPEDKTYGCDLCKVECNAEISLQEHLNSAKHHRKLEIHRMAQQFAAQNAALAPTSGDVSSPVQPLSLGPSFPRPSSVGPSSAGPSSASNPSVITCTVCNVPISGYENYTAHMRGKQHAKRLRQAGGMSC